MGKKAVTSELLRVEESVDHSAQSQFSSTKFWNGTHLILGVLAAGAAGLAGASILAELWGATATGVAALAAAGAGAVQTALNPSQRAERAHVAANSYLALQSEARVLRTVHLTDLSDADAGVQLDAIIAKQAEINMSAPVPSLAAYLAGRRNVRKGRTKYEVDRRS